MKDEEILRDILDFKIHNQIYYNESIINVRNPEARQLFKSMRDDEMRHIIKLQQKIERLYSKTNIISKIFPTKAKY
ncbi:hypothetical protein [Sporosalibacterium faouarense]|uniref:hypothetical protein n=1 Tax=Sporosalibacterium faouarense TaxID=516123 RepID=UPI00141CD045|nr:hypothetical protein [Sporosalibacterium faouarense]MTI49627.1 hypothetical protein [Bacillota bacterium]